MRNIFFAKDIWTKAILIVALFSGFRALDAEEPRIKPMERERKSIGERLPVSESFSSARTAIEEKLHFETTRQEQNKPEAKPIQPKPESVTRQPKPESVAQQPKPGEVTQPEEKVLSFKERQAKLQESLRFKPATTAKPLEVKPLSVEESEQQRLEKAIQKGSTAALTSTTPKFEVKFETPKEPTAEDAEKNIDKTQVDLNQSKKELDDIGKRLKEALQSGNKELADQLSLQASEKQSKIQETESTLRQYEELLGRKTEGPSATERYAKMATEAEELRSKFGQTVSYAPVGPTSRQAEVSRVQEDLMQPSKGKTSKEQAADFIKKHRVALGVGVGIGIGALALAGIIGAILGTLPSKDSGTAASQPGVGPIPILPPAPAPAPVPEIKPDIGIVTPSPYPAPNDGNQDHQQVVNSVASFYMDLDEKFKQALETASYFDKKFIIEGKAKIGESTEKISIEYNFVDEGAGEFGSPFTPFLVKMIPQGINGVALNPDDIKNILPDGPAKELFIMMIQPDAAFIFMIKIILLINTTLRDTSKEDVDKINFIIDEASRLYSRLILTPNQDPTPDAIIAKMPKTFQQIIGDISLKMFGDLVYNVSDPENTVLIEKINELQKLKDYLGITNFIKKEISPIIKKDMTHMEKKLLLYSLQKHLSDCPKTGRDLWNHLDQLISMLTDVKESMVKAKIDKKTVAEIEILLQKVQNVRAGIKKVTVLSKKPEFEISTEIYGKNVSLNNALKILFKNFSKIYYAKFEGDKGYLYSDVLLGKNATKYALQSIFYRCLSETLQANQILSTAKGTVTLRMSDGQDSIINPDQEFTKICNKSSLKLVQAQAILKNAILKLRATPNDAQLENAYDQAITAVNNAAQALSADQIKFRCTFAAYVPMKQSDGSMQTPAKLLQNRLALLKKNSKYVDGIIASEYESFSNALGFSPAFIGVK